MTFDQKQWRWPCGFLCSLSLLTHALWYDSCDVCVCDEKSNHHCGFFHLGVFEYFLCGLALLHCILYLKKSTLLIKKLQCNVTCIGIEDGKCSSEPQHNVNLEKVVDDDTDDKENRHTAKHQSHGKYEVGLCRDGHHKYRTYDFSTMNVC